MFPFIHPHSRSSAPFCHQRQSSVHRIPPFSGERVFWPSPGLIGPLPERSGKALLASHRDHFQALVPIRTVHVQPALLIRLTTHLPGSPEETKGVSGLYLHLLVPCGLALPDQEALALLACLLRCSRPTLHLALLQLHAILFSWRIPRLALYPRFFLSTSLSGVNLDYQSVGRDCCPSRGPSVVCSSTINSVQSLSLTPWRPINPSQSPCSSSRSRCFLLPQIWHGC